MLLGWSLSSLQVCHHCLFLLLWLWVDFVLNRTTHSIKHSFLMTRCPKHIYKKTLWWPTPLVNDRCKKFQSSSALKMLWGIVWMLIQTFVSSINEVIWKHLWLELLKVIKLRCCELLHCKSVMQFVICHMLSATNCVSMAMAQWWAVNIMQDSILIFNLIHVVPPPTCHTTFAQYDCCYCLLIISNVLLSIHSNLITHI